MINGINNKEERVYYRSKTIIFKKTKEDFGGLSNMAGGFPIMINGVNILTSEALYQSCRFPHLPDIQRLIIEQKSPMTAKMKSKPHRSNSRDDWQNVRIPIMRWCLRIKLLQNIDSFYPLLLSTGNSEIVEESKKDSFWGALPINEDKLKGFNALGRLLMELRDEFANVENKVYILNPPAISNFYLLGEPIKSMEIPCYFSIVNEKKVNIQITFEDF